MRPGYTSLSFPEADGHGMERFETNAMKPFWQDVIGWVGGGYV